MREGRSAMGDGGVKNRVDYAGVEALATRAVRHAGDAAAALQAGVEVLKSAVPHYSWVGVYLIDGDELVLGPSLGKPSPHTRIPLGRGICGAAATERQTIIVDDVNSDARYLACSLETKSEIVVPIMKHGEVLGEIDIDSDQPAAFGTLDREMLESVAEAMAARL